MGQGYKPNLSVAGRCVVGLFVLVLQVNLQAVEDRR
jgi:hypothetical protein